MVFEMDTKYIYSNWIPWSGGECPIPESTSVEVRFRNKEKNSYLTAECWSWTHSQGGYDITEFRFFVEKNDPLVYQIAKTLRDQLNLILVRTKNGFSTILSGVCEAQTNTENSPCI